jgi:hypothetical protein
LKALLSGRDGVHSNKKFAIVRLIAKVTFMLRRRCGVVTDEEYVQEHILTGGMSRRSDSPRRLIHGRLQPVQSALSRHTDASFLVWPFCAGFESRRRS